MRRYVSLLATTMLAFATPLAAASSASAFGGETLQCSISPGGESYPDSSTCDNNLQAAVNYTVTFSVQGGTGTYSHSWNVPAATGVSVQSGCTATTSYCNVSVGALNNYVYLTVTDTISQDGQQTTLSASAEVFATCFFKPHLIQC